MVDLDALTTAVEKGDRSRAVDLTQAAIDEGVGPAEILDAMIRAMTSVGDRFARSDGVYIPEMLISARAMKSATALLEPMLEASGITPEYTAVVGTVKGDLHDIGKNLVATMLKGANFAVIDLGTNVPPTRFAEAARDHKADIVGISALLTTTMVGMQDAVEAIRTAAPAARILVGGAPVTLEYAVAIGADSYAKDAASATVIARRMLTS